MNFDDAINLSELPSSASHVRALALKNANAIFKAFLTF